MLEMLSSFLSCKLLENGGIKKWGEHMSNIDQVQKLIPIGSERPITAKQIQEITHIPLREIYAIIRYLVIHAKLPVGALRDANKHGYFIITNENERQATLAPLISHANEIEERISAIKGIEI